MGFDRRQFLSSSLISAAAARADAPAKPKLGIPGPFRGRVVAVEHPGSIVQNVYQREPVHEMLHKGMMELTGAPGWLDAWRYFFEPGDVVGIKINPAGQPYILSDATVVQEIVASLEAVGIKRQDIIAYDRFQAEFLAGGVDKWLPEGVRWMCGTVKSNILQLDMDGYDENVYVEMPLVGQRGDPSNPHHRRSYVAKFLSRHTNKLINLGVIKHHQSAGITVALKNLSHGLVNNVARSHVSSSNNACGMFIPTVLDKQIFRDKVVLNIIDGVRGAYHGGPNRKVARYLWEHKTMYFATDPVAMDRIAWDVIDLKRGQMGMEPVALARADNDSVFVRMQPEFIEIAGMLGLGESNPDKIDLRKFKIGQPSVA